MIYFEEIRAFVESGDYVGLLRRVENETVPVYEDLAPNGVALAATLTNLYLLLEEFVADESDDKYWVELDDDLILDLDDAILRYGEWIMDLQLKTYLKLQPMVKKHNDGVKRHLAVLRGHETKKSKTEERNEVIRQIATDSRLKSASAKASLIHKKWDDYPELINEQRLSERQIREILRCNDEN